MCRYYCVHFTYVNSVLTTTYEIRTIAVPILQMRKKRHNQEQKSQALDPGHSAAEPAFVISALSLTDVSYGEFWGGGDSPEYPISQTGLQGWLCSWKEPAGPRSSSYRKLLIQAWIPDLLPRIPCSSIPLAHTVCPRLYQGAEPLALISFEAMKSHLQRINATLSWPGPACFLEKRSLESNPVGRHLPEHLLAKSNYALRGRLK